MFKKLKKIFKSPNIFSTDLAQTEIKRIELYLEISFGFIKTLKVKNCECECMYCKIVHDIGNVYSITCKCKLKL